MSTRLSKERETSRARARVAGIQRARLLTAAVGAIDELGYWGATVDRITTRARVSRRTFYELFADRQGCLVAVIDAAIMRVQAELAEADLREVAWRERVHVGLGVILGFLESEPALARVCVVHALHGGSCALERRERVLKTLAAIVDEGRKEQARTNVSISPLTAEALVGAAFMVLHTRLLERRGNESLTDLRGELNALIVLPYLGPAAARHERCRKASAPLSPRRPADAALAASDPLTDLTMRLTYRTTRVLEGVADHPGASNREVSEYAGIQDQGQVSKLLARLERIGLLANAGHAKGEPNAWHLTARGKQVAYSIRAHARRDERWVA